MAYCAFCVSLREIIQILHFIERATKYKHELKKHVLFQVNSTTPQPDSTRPAWLKLSTTFILGISFIGKDASSYIAFTRMLFGCFIFEFYIFIFGTL